MIKNIFLFCALFFLIKNTLKCQEAQSDTTYSPTFALSGEKIGLFTDRNIYCVNENIYFTAEYSSLKELDSLEWSNVLYIELIKWNGIKLVQMKLILNKQGTSGSMQIPDDVLSGNYYLRAYTKWMRNFSAHEYAYLPVKIVNPFRYETDEGPSETSAPGKSTTLNTEHKSSMNKREYGPGEKAEVELNINNNKIFNFDRYCVSVVKVGAVDTSAQFYEPESNSLESNLSNMEYLPEIRGITISGEVIDKSTKLSQKDILVSLSEPKSGEYFSFYKTNEKGHFVFSLPNMIGQHDFFIQAESNSSNPTEILIDNGFCNKPVKLPYQAFRLTEDEIQLIKDMSINMQLSKKFLSKEDTSVNSQLKKTEPLTFYGSKKTIYYTEKYIELPNIEEFINEIVLEADLIKEKGKNSLINMRRTNLSSYPTLVLLDNVKINNDEQLLKIPLNRINRIEVINMDYIVAGIKYNGIIIIYSQNKDFAGLGLNKNSSFFTYELFSDKNSGFNFSSRPSNSRIADRRNLLYWNPDIQLSVDKKKTLSFYTSDSKGDYIVYIRGKNCNDIREVYGKCYFLVK